MTASPTTEVPPKAPDAPSEGLAADLGTPGQEEPQEGEESFSREYVAQLRNEAREHRVKAQRADFLATEVRRLATREAVRGVLTDPEALAWSDDFEGEDGLPDHDKLRAAAEALATARPWLARVRGDIAQGEHSDAPAGLSLSELLRA